MKRRDLLITVLALLAIWQLAALSINRPILPTPILVGEALWRELSAGELGAHFLSSLWRVLASTFLALVTAAPLGMILGQSQRINSLLAMQGGLSVFGKIVKSALLDLAFGIYHNPTTRIQQVGLLTRPSRCGTRPCPKR